MKARELLLRNRKISLEAEDAEKEEKEKEEPETKDKEETPEDKGDEKEEKEDESAEEPEDSEAEPAEPETDDSESADGDVDEETSTEEEDEPAESSDASTDADTSDNDSSDDVSSEESPEASEETTVPVEGDVDSSVGVDEKEILDLNGFEMSEEEAVDAAEDVAVATDALESIYLSIQASLESGGLTTQAYSFATNYANQVCKSIGLDPVTTGLESADTRLNMSIAAMESLKETIKKGWVATVEFLTRLYNAIRARILKFKESVPGILEKIADMLNRATPDVFSKEIEARVQYFYVNGKLSGNLVQDISRSIENVQNFTDRDFVSSYDRLLDSVRWTAEHHDIDDMLEDVRKTNEKAYNIANNILRFDQNGLGVPTTHLAGKVRTGIRFTPEAQRPSAMLGLNHAIDTSSPVKVTLSKLGIRQSSAVALLETAKNKLPVFLKQYDDVADKFKQRVSKIADLAQKWDEDPKFQKLNRVNIEVHRSVSVYLRLASDLVNSLIDAIYELNHAIAAASKTEI